MATTQQQQHDLHRVFEAGGGVVTIVVICNRASMSLIAAAKRGDVNAKAILVAVGKLLEGLENLEAGATTPCLLCEAGALSHSNTPGGIAVLVPSVEIVRVATAMGFCRSCAANRSETELTAAIVAKLGDGTVPGLRDLRILPAMAPAGHA